MRVKNSMIDKELRNAGRVIKIVIHTFSRTKLSVFGTLSRKGLIKMKDDSIKYSQEWITRADGSRLRLAIFQSLHPRNNVPGVLWLHGGGYALGAPEQSLRIIKKIIETNNGVVIAPDYRLSIEAPYPAALEDSYAALRWMKNHAGKFGIRDDQLMIGGESAGGGLTAALALYARDKGEVAVAFQMPLYPMLDDRMDSDSAKDNNAPLWNSTSNYNGWKLYLGELFGKADVPAYAAPARAADYRNLPPAATFVGELEPFRDETIRYIENLRQAGVPADIDVCKGCFHAFDVVCPRAEVSKRAINFLMESLKYATEHYFAEQKILDGEGLNGR